MGRRFHIDGTQEFGYSFVKKYLYSFYFYMNAVKRVCGLYPFASVNYIKGYVARFCYIRLKSFDTLLKVAIEHKDYVTAACILRMLGDCVSVFRLVYMEPNGDLRLLRHCLYILDGCERNLVVIPEENNNKKCMPKEEWGDFDKQVKFNRDLRLRMMKEAQGMLDSSPLKVTDESAFNKIVEDRNWKFKEFKWYKKVGSNQYQWKELYDLIGMCEQYDLFSYISQYAHGLSMSNLIIEMDEVNCDGIVGEALGLINRMIEYMAVFFAEERVYILHGLLEPEMRDKMLSCFDEKYRPSVKEWEQEVFNEIKKIN